MRHPALLVLGFVLLPVVVACGGGTSEPDIDATVIRENGIAIRELPPAVGGLMGAFDQYVNVLGMQKVATDGVPRDRLLHVHLVR